MAATVIHRLTLWPGERYRLLRASGFKLSNLCPFSNSQISVKFLNLWQFLTFSNWHPMMSLMYALILTNKSAIDLRIWKGWRFENNP
jgi:hypothetical protein